MSVWRSTSTSPTLVTMSTDISENFPLLPGGKRMAVARSTGAGGGVDAGGAPPRRGEP
uniref:Uncharacterized protein n=1 Tax=Arundo donax TaxID=35708 RepID=A0A0A9GT80_ARUDO